MDPLRAKIKQIVKEEYEGLGPMPAEWGPRHFNHGGTRFIDQIYGNFRNTLTALVGDVKKVGTVMVSVGQATLETALSALIPEFQVNIKRILDKRNERLDAIQKKYQPFYDEVNRAFTASNIGMIAFMANPLYYLAYETLAATTDPFAVLDMYKNMFADGNPIVADVINDISMTVKRAANTMAGKELFDLQVNLMADGRLANAIAGTRQYRDVRKTADSVIKDQNHDINKQLSDISQEKTLEDLSRLSGGKFKVAADFTKLDKEQQQQIEAAIHREITIVNAQQMIIGLEKSMETLRKMSMNKNSKLYRNLEAMVQVLQRKVSQMSSTPPVIKPSEPPPAKPTLTSQEVKDREAKKAEKEKEKAQKASSKAKAKQDKAKGAADAKQKAAQKPGAIDPKKKDNRPAQ